MALSPAAAKTGWKRLTEHVELWWLAATLLWGLVMSVIVFYWRA